MSQRKCKSNIRVLLEDYTEDFISQSLVDELYDAAHSHDDDSENEEKSYLGRIRDLEDKLEALSKDVRKLDKRLG